MISIVGQFFRNVFASYANMVIAFVVTFFFTPYFISMIGKEQYGIWSLAFSFLTYMGLADLGMKQALVRHISKNLGAGDWKGLNRVFSSSALIYAFVALLVMVATFMLSFWLLKYFQIPDNLFQTARLVVIIFGVHIAISYLFLPFAALGAYNRFDITNYFLSGQRLAQTGFIVLLLELGHGLVEVALVVAVLQFIAAMTKNFIRMRLFPQSNFSISLIDKKTIKELMGYSVYAFLIVISWVVIYQTDNIVIGRFLSMEAVAIYAIPAMFITQVRSLFTVISVPLVPAISQLEAEKNIDKIMNIYSRSTRYLYYISTYIAIATLTFGGAFILLWLEQDFSGSINILYILMIPAVISLPQTVANSVLYGISKHRISFYILGLEAVINITLSLILVHYWGIIGVAVGTAIPQLINYILVYPIVFYRVMEADVKEFYKTAAVSIFYGILSILPIAVGLRYLLKPDSWLTLITDCVLVSLVMIVVLFRVILTTEDRNRLLRKIKSKLPFLQKKSINN